LDVGTNNQSLLDDPTYIGLKQRRVEGQEYDDFIDEFMKAVVARYGQNTLIQFEDFGNRNASRLLAKYQDKYCTFNDDIQGTASVAVAGFLASLRITNAKLTDNVFLFLGAGEASLGIAQLLVRAMVIEGMSEKDAIGQVWLVDSKGLIVKSRTDTMGHEKKMFIKDAPEIKDFLEAIKHVKPTAIIGASAQPGAFNEEIIRTMADINERPIILALSNPTSKAECTAEQAYKFTDGRVIFASGSPFAPVEYKGKRFVPGQGNNAYIFPGVSLGVIAAGVRHISDDVFLLAAKTLANLVTDQDLALGRLYPHQSAIFQASQIIARVVAEDAYKNGTASTYPEPLDKGEFIRSQIYNYKYPGSHPALYKWPGISE
jgi:malate dehydrogenase (oxaloacetate-decarboxylating)(NADP+)